MSQNPIQGDDGVQRVLSGLGKRRCALESFRDGRIIDGYVCRFTLGRLALINIAGCKIFADEGEISVEDVLMFLWFTREDNIDKAVYVADDHEALGLIIKKMLRSRLTRRMNAIISDVQDWLCDISDTMPQCSSDDHGKLRAEWWVDAVDCIASQYGWDEEFILWYLPFCRAIKYQERICARENGESVVDDISGDIITAIDKLEELKNAKG